MLVVYDELESTVSLIDEFFFDVIYEVRVMEKADVEVMVNFFILYSSII